jgi:type IX secretion system PorP/SprF family membrane protein
LKKALAIVSILLSFGSFAQQDFQNSQYMFNLFSINPAYAGSNDALSINVSHRSQFVGFEGAPNTQQFSIHAPVTKKKIGLGLEITNDVIGPRKVIGVHTAYAYRVKVGPGQLGFGLKAGVYNYKYDWDILNYQDNTEDLIGTGTESKIVPNFNFGMYYHDKLNYAGIELAHLNNPSIYSNDSIGDVQARLSTHLSAFAGRAFELNDKLVLKPSVLVRFAQNAPGYADINISVLYNKRIWLGASYRTNKALILISQVYVLPQLKVGYSYDLLLSELSTYQGGAHEIYLGYDLNFVKSSNLSPRYF